MSKASPLGIVGRLLTGASLFLVGAGVGFGAGYWYHPSWLFAFNQSRQESLAGGRV